MRRAAALVLFLAAPAAVVAAEHFPNVGLELPGCRDYVGHQGDGEFRQGLCVGTVVGAWFLSEVGEAVCIPAGTGLEQVIWAVVAYGEAHRVDGQQPMAALAANALSALWPCRHPAPGKP